MESARAIELVHNLADRVDPFTGERFPSDSPCQQADTARAQHLVLEGLVKLKRSTARKAIDTIHGRIVNVDIDVDANHDGAINGADEPLEVDPGGLACVCTNKLTPIKLKLQPAGLPGKVTFSATMSGRRIKVWRNANRAGQIDLSKRGNVVPGTLYVEGVVPSAALRIRTRPRSTLNRAQQPHRCTSRSTIRRKQRYPRPKHHHHRRRLL
ncbi:MAG: hypothetical protein ACOX5G_10440 [Kiritimatiellia bacterium]|jgi:hypothetical protein